MDHSFYKCEETESPGTCTLYLHPLNSPLQDLPDEQWVGEPGEMEQEEGVPAGQRVRLQVIVYTIFMILTFVCIIYIKSWFTRES